MSATSSSLRGSRHAFVLFERGVRKNSDEAMCNSKRDFGTTAAAAAIALLLASGKHQAARDLCDH
jgi:hypothetical protein